MSFFGKILNKLGFGDDKPAAAAPAATPSAPAAPAPAAVAPASAPAPAPAPSAPAITPVSTVDVVAKLESLASRHTEKLNWRTSIVDLLKLLEIDSSLAARKELATELGCPAEKMADSAQMNMWLHKTVLQKIADNGGNIPAELFN